MPKSRQRNRSTPLAIVGGVLLTVGILLLLINVYSLVTLFNITVPFLTNLLTPLMNQWMPLITQAAAFLQISPVLFMALTIAASVLIGVTAGIVLGVGLSKKPESRSIDFSYKGDYPPADSYDNDSSYNHMGNTKRFMGNKKGNQESLKEEFQSYGS